jgi:HlyD family secretion protein
MKRERQAARGESDQPEGQQTKQRLCQASQAGFQAPFQMGAGSMRGRMRDMGRLWIEDESGKLKMIFVKTGVTDNIYTEITGGEIKEGMEVITGEAAQSASSNRQSNDLRRGMMFMRR